MPIGEYQRKARRKHIGSSDAAKILGVSRWGTASDVYWSKILEPGDDEPTEAMMTGNRLEGPLIDFACEELGVEATRNQFRVASLGDGIPAANFDALVNGKREAIECKFVGHTQVDEWGDPGTDAVSDDTILQCQHQMLVGDLDRVWVAAAIARYSLEWAIYSVPRNDPIIKAMLEAELNFWHNHVLPQIPPDDSPPPLELLKRLRREPESIIDLDDAAIEAWQRRELCGKAKKLAEDDYDSATAEVLALLADNEAGRLPNGAMLTYLSQRGAPRFDQKRLRAEHPKIYETYATETSHRVLRLKSPRKEN